MGFVKQDAAGNLVDTSPDELAAQAPWLEKYKTTVSPGFAEQFDAATRLNTTWGSLLAAGKAGVPPNYYDDRAALGSGGATGTGETEGPGFQPLDWMTPEEKAYYGEAFGTANSHRDMEFIRKQIAEENNARRVLEEGPMWDWAIGLLAGATDPVNYIPFFGVAGKGAKAVMSVATNVAGQTAAQEAILQGTQYGRTTEESVSNIVTSAIFGAGLGALGARWGTRAMDLPAPLREALADDLTAMLRATGQGDFKLPSRGLLDSTAIDAGLILGRDAPTEIKAEINYPAKMLRNYTRSEVIPYVDATNKELFDTLFSYKNRLDGVERQLAKLESEDSVNALPFELEKARNDLNDQRANLRKKLAEAETRAAAEVDKAAARMNAMLPQWTPEKAALAVAEILEKRVALQTAMLEHLAAGKPVAALNKREDILGWLEGIAARKDLLPSEKPSVKAKEQAAPEPDQAASGGRKSVSAAAVVTVPDVAHQLANSFGVIEFMNKLPAGLKAPGLELAASVFATSRKWVKEIAYSGLINKGVMSGIPNPRAFAQRLIKYQTVVDNAATLFTATYKDYARAMREQGTPALSKSEFGEQVAKAMRRGDEHPVKEIKDFAQVLRKEVYDPLKKAAEERGLLPADVKTLFADSYLNRSYNHEMIRHQRPTFRAIIKHWLKDTQEFELRKKGPPKLEDYGKLLDDNELDELAESIINNIQGTSSNRLPRSELTIPAVRGPLKERTLAIPDTWHGPDGAAFKFEDFLDSNILSATAKYVKTMGADIEFHDTFAKGEVGANKGREGLGYMLDELREEARALADAAPNEKARAAIEAQSRREGILLERLVDRYRGIDAMPIDPTMAALGSIGRVARNVNFYRLMGQSLFSQFSDAGKMVMEEGLLRTFGAIFGDLLTGFQGVKLGVRQGRMFGVANDMISPHTTAAQLDITEQYLAQNKWERWSSLGARYAATAFGLPLMNTYTQGMTSLLAGSRILETATLLASGGEPSARAMRKFLEAGFDKADAVAIAAQSKHFEKVNGLWYANADKWDDAGARNAFGYAIAQDVENTIFRPGAIDKPLWTTEEWGRVVSQLKGFAFTANQRIFLSGLQARDMYVMNGIVTMVGMGMFGRALIDLNTNGEVDRKRSVAGWIREGIDRSGAFAYLMETDSIVGKATGKSMAKMLTGEEQQRTAQLGIVERLLGPSAGLVSDIGRVTRGVSDGKLTQSDLGAGMNLILPTRMIGLRQGFSAIEEGLADYYGLTPRPPRQ